MKRLDNFLRWLRTIATRYQEAKYIYRIGMVLTIAGVAIVVSLRSYANAQTSASEVSSTIGTGNQGEAVSTIEDAMRRFTSRTDSGEIDNVIVHCRTWNSYTSKSVSERDLMAHPSDCDMVLRGWAMREPTRMLAGCFRNYHLTKRKTISSEVDFALGVIFRSGDEEVLRVCISKEPAFVSINGEFFRAEIQVVYPLTMFLPPSVREDMFTNAILRWASPSYDGSPNGESAERDWLSTLAEEMKKAREGAKKD